MSIHDINLVDLQSADNAWLKLPRDLRVEDFANPLANATQWDKENLDIFLGKILVNPDYLSTFCKLILDVHLLPLHAIIMRNMWFKAFPMMIMCRGGAKSFSLALYSILKCTLVPNTNVILTGSAFRQSKIIFEYAEKILNNAPILRDICSIDIARAMDMHRIGINNSSIIAIPTGTGDKIRGLRANVIVADEFAAQSPQIYETVIVGFGAVMQDPIVSAKLAHKRERLIEMGTWNDNQEITFQSRQRNQAIIAGTADYGFNHFSEYHQRYKACIETRGDTKAMEQIFNGEVPKGVSWKDFSIIRVPYELMPTGFLDDKQIGRAQATMNTIIFSMEYHCIFPKDSAGFFKRSLIEKCTTSNQIPIHGEVFDPLTRGNPNKKYVYGIDPAIQTDNFAIVIVELNEDHNRLVYCWTTNKRDFRKRHKLGQEIEHDFYAFAARKIRNLMKVFPCVRIGLDAQGGGRSIEEALHDPKKLNKAENEELLWEIIEEDKEKPTDDEEGNHCLEMIQFADYEWTSGANNGLLKDMQDKFIVFPRYDTFSVGLAYEMGELGLNEASDEYQDSLEDLFHEIEELKNELTTIVMSRTGLGQGARDRWDTPEVKDPATQKKGRLRKDRYSAFLIANMIGRQLSRASAPVRNTLIGDHVKNFPQKNFQSNQLYQGANAYDGSVCIGIVKGIEEFGV